MTTPVPVPHVQSAPVAAAPPKPVVTPVPKLLFKKAAKRDVQVGENNRLPSQFEVPADHLSKTAGQYVVSPDGAFIYLRPYSGKDSGKAIAIPIAKIQTYIETDTRPVDPFAPIQ